MPDPKPQLSPEEVDRLLEKAVGQAEGAVSASAVAKALPKGLRPSAETVKERLTRLVRDGRLHLWRGGTLPLYSARPYADHLREWLLETLTAEPQTVGQLRKRVPAAGQKALTTVLAELTRSGRVRKHPRLGRRDLYSTRPPDPLSYLRRPLEAELKKLEKKGFTRDALLEALRHYAGGAAPAGAGGAPPAATERVLAALVELNPKVRDGELVYIPHLRQAMAGELAEKPAFDRAVLALEAQGRVQLQSHPVPSQLNDHEKQTMVPDGRGSWFMAIGLRRT